MKQTIIFAAMFLLIGPATRAMLAGRLGAFGDWMGAWSPFSYIIIAVVCAAPIAAAQLLLTWPKHVEPGNAMTKYLRDHPTADID